ncbi:unnamed protein product [Polarella glacialis]|uniref:Uncharacterized protein n=1 Tax=Polarella glacialis TaxID=89957 RepID=A0A813ERZ9_POLGL|nr:unnamed protein product [Polarella glacialis]
MESEVLSRHGFQSDLDAVVRTRRPTMPWEAAPMVSIALGARDFTPWLAFGMSVSSQPAATGLRAKQALTVAYMPRVKAKRRRIMDEAAGMTSDDLVARLFSGWLVVIQHDAHASRVGRQILALQDSAESEFKIHELMEDLFAVKSSSTLSARLTAIQLYLHEQLKADPSRLYLPIVEQELYE